MSRHQKVHMRTDGDAELDALFSVLNNKEALLCSSFKNRKLPASFFTPPPTKHANMGHKGRQTNDLQEYPHHGAMHCRSISSPSQAVDNYWNQQANNYPGGSYQQQPYFSTFYDKHPQNNSNISQPISNYDEFNSYNYQQQLNTRQWGPYIPDNDLFFANKLFGFENFDLKELEKSSPMCEISSPMEQQNCIQYELQALQQHKLRNQEKQEALLNRELMLAELAKNTTVLQPEELSQLKPPKQHNKQCFNDIHHYQQHNRHFPNKQQQQQLKQNIHQQVKLNPQQFKQQQQGQQQLKHNTPQHYLKSIDVAFNDSHIRQNSTDSGLGGMGTTYSLPRSPDEYLSHVDEGDGREEDGEEKSRMQGIFN